MLIFFFFRLKIFQNCAILDFVLRIPLDAFEYQNVVIFLEHTMRNLYDDCMFGYRCGVLELVVIEEKVILDTIQGPEGIWLFL